MEKQKSNRLTLEKAKEIFDYDPKTGKLFWKERINEFWNKRYANTEALGHVGKHGYKVGSVDKRNYRAHRVVWLIFYGEFPKEQIDHIDGDRTNNKIDNLREVTNEFNSKNKGMIKTSKSFYPGVRQHKNGSYRVKAVLKGKQIHLGYYKSLDEAILIKKEFENNNGYHKNHGR